MGARVRASGLITSGLGIKKGVDPEAPTISSEDPDKERRFSTSGQRMMVGPPLNVSSFRQLSCSIPDDYGKFATSSLSILTDLLLDVILKP